MVSNLSFLIPNSSLASRVHSGDLSLHGPVHSSELVSFRLFHRQKEQSPMVWGRRPSATMQGGRRSMDKYAKKENDTFQRQRALRLPKYSCDIRISTGDRYSAARKCPSRPPQSCYASCTWLYIRIVSIHPYLFVDLLSCLENRLRN